MKNLSSPNHSAHFNHKKFIWSTLIVCCLLLPLLFLHKCSPTGCTHSGAMTDSIAVERIAPVDTVAVAAVVASEDAKPTVHDSVAVVNEEAKPVGQAVKAETITQTENNQPNFNTRADSAEAPSAPVAASKPEVASADSAHEANAEHAYYARETDAEKTVAAVVASEDVKPAEEAAAVATTAAAVESAAVASTAAVENAAVESAAAKVDTARTQEIESAAVATAAAENAAVESAPAKVDTARTQEIENATVATTAVENVAVESTAAVAAVTVASEDAKPTEEAAAVSTTNAPVDTVADEAVVASEDVKPAEVMVPYAPKNDVVALRTNLLYDAVLVPNIGIEVWLGKQFTLGADWFGTWLSNSQKNWYWQGYGGYLTLRYYFGRQAAERRFTGHHVGLYGSALTYDVEFGGKGYQAAKFGFGGGVEYGYSLQVHRCLAIDFTLGVGYQGGEYKTYQPTVDGTGHYVWLATYNRNWWGPTKAEISLKWLIAPVDKKKGGER